MNRIISGPVYMEHGTFVTFQAAVRNKLALTKGNSQFNLQSSESHSRSVHSCDPHEIQRYSIAAYSATDIDEICQY